MYNCQSNSARFIYTLSSTLLNEQYLYKKVLQISPINNTEVKIKFNNKRHKNECETNSSKTNEDFIICQLKNGFYFTKEPRSDEKIRFTETDMTSIVRTILFTYCFNIKPMQSILQIVTFGDVDYNFKKLRLKHKLTPTTIIALLDMLFGDGFAIIVKRPILTVYKEYMTSWRNVPF